MITPHYHITVRRQLTNIGDAYEKGLISWEQAVKLAEEAKKENNRE